MAGEADERSRRFPSAPPPPWVVFPPPWEVLPSPRSLFDNTAATREEAKRIVLAALQQFPETWTIKQVLEHVTSGSPELPPPHASESSAPSDKNPGRVELRKRARFA